MSTTSEIVSRCEALFTDMDFAALEVREKYARIKHQLPEEIERPVIARYEESDAYVMIAAVTSNKYTTEYLRKLIDEEIKEYLLRVDGVANVDVYGGRERRVLVEMDQARLAAEHDGWVATMLNWTTSHEAMRKKGMGELEGIVTLVDTKS